MEHKALGTAAASAIVWALVSGCSGQKIKTHPVAGKVVLAGGDVAILTRSSVELQTAADEALRPIGNLDAAGNFTITTLYQGDILPGAPEGSYKARIILADPSDEGVPKRKGNPIHSRFFDFNTSGLKLTVPSNDYTLSVSK